MLVFRAGLYLLPFRALCHWLYRMEAAVGSCSGREKEEAARIARSILRASKLLGWRDDCLPQALTACFLMKRHGLAASLHFGVKKGPDGELRAHAWVEYDGEIVVGGTKGNVQSYTPLTGFNRVIP